MRKALLLFALTVLLSVCAFAADVAGNWKGAMETPMGTQEMTLALKVDGQNITGTMSGAAGETKIEKAKLEGDALSFEVQSEYGTLSYSGVVKGDELNLKLSVMGMEMPLPMKRVK